MHHEDPGSWGPGIIGIAAVLEALLIIVIALRIYTRVWIAKAFWWDDFTILLAAVGGPFPPSPSPLLYNE